MAVSEAFLRLVNNPLQFRLFLLAKLPVAFFSGLKIEKIDAGACTVSVPYKWLTKNPFRSTYFASLSMAAEMSIGALAMANTYKQTPPVSMLPVSIEGNFYKKAVGKTFFTCTDGIIISETIQQVILLNYPQTIKALTTGYNLQKEKIAEFWFTWSFKVK
ncbi:MAG: DUF4442 domain-containing protein [Flavisolibacter sp.]|nr:DUF4442 domain-containing protein [Flavisolibacter sp.]